MQSTMPRSTLVLPADVAKLADAQDSGSCGVTPMEVRFLSSALKVRPKWSDFLCAFTLVLPRGHLFNDWWLRRAALHLRSDLLG